jgi:hypothetical protein
MLREPLLHFLLLGAALFALAAIAGRGSGTGVSGGSDKQIVVSSENVTLLNSGFVLDNGRDPTDAELPRLVRAEFTAQYRRCCELLGHPPDIVNTHHHVQVFRPIGTILKQIIRDQKPVPYMRLVVPGVQPALRAALT